MKVTIVFPGQGTQYVSMGAVFSGHAHYATANLATGYDLQKMMHEGPAEDLKLTENTQPGPSCIIFCRGSSRRSQTNREYSACDCHAFTDHV